MRNLDADLEQNNIVINGTPFPAFPGVVETLYILLSEYPKSVTMNGILSRLYGASGGPDTAYTVVRVRVNDIRNYLDGTEWRIDSKRAKSGRSTYQLVREV